jgi:hypothetical protein
LSLQRWGQTAATNKKFTSIDRRRSVNENAVLRELFELLEDYAPSWYTEEIHDRAAAALGDLQTQSSIN